MAAIDVPSRLAVSTDHDGPKCGLVLRGSLDHDTIGVLEEHLDVLGCCECDEVVIDLSRLDHLDSVGARVLISLEHYVRGRGSRLELIGARPVAEALLHDTGIEEADK